MAIAVPLNTGTGTGVDATSFTRSLTAVAGSMYVTTFTGERTGANPPDPTVTHNSVTATKITSLVYVTAADPRRTIWVYAWDGGAGSALVNVTYDFGGVTLTGFECKVFEVTGSDMANGLSQTFVQSPNTGADLSGTSGSITLAAAGDANNRPFAVFAHAANETLGIRTNWSAIGAEGTHANPDNSTRAFWRSDTFETTASSSWTTSAAYGGIAFEIKAASAGGGVAVIDPFGMSGFFG